MFLLHCHGIDQIVPARLIRLHLPPAEVPLGIVLHGFSGHLMGSLWKPGGDPAMRASSGTVGYEHQERALYSVRHAGRRGRSSQHSARLYYFDAAYSNGLAFEHGQAAETPVDLYICYGGQVSLSLAAKCIDQGHNQLTHVKRLCCLDCASILRWQSGINGGHDLGRPSCRTCLHRGALGWFSRLINSHLPTSLAPSLLSW